MTDCGNKPIFLGSTWSSYPPRFIQNILFSEETPHKTYIPHIPASVYSICFHNPKIPAVWSFSWIFFSFQFFACLSFIFSVYAYLDRHILFPVLYKYVCQFASTKIIIWHFYSIFSTPAIFSEQNGANVCDTQYHHSNNWWHHNSKCWRKHIHCRFIGGNYHFELCH